MLNEKLILVFFFLILIISSRSYSQETEVSDLNQKLDIVFNNGGCAFEKTLDKSVLWKENYGIRFLLRKLDSQNDRDKMLAISYLSYSKKIELIEIIAPHLNSPNELLAMNTVRALTSIGGFKSTSLLEEQLLLADKSKIGLIYNILNGLNVLTNEFSLIYLDSFIKKCDTKKLLEVRYLNKAKKISETIERYHSNDQSQKKLIEMALFSDDADDFNWARVKIQQSGDAAYLPLLVKVKSHLDSINSNYKKKNIIKLMDYLGEKKFSKEDVLFLNELKQSIEVQKARTMDLFRQPLLNCKVKDF